MNTVYRRRSFLALALAASSCIPVADNFIPALDPTLVPALGGLADTRPFFGSLVPASGSGLLGEVMLASCGCGDWRILVRQANGGGDLQFPVGFYTRGEYQPTGQVTVYGVDGQESLSGSVDQDLGSFSARLQSGAARMLASGQRSDAHDLAIEACVLCHIVDDPIWPLPPQHPAEAYTSPPPCLNCHSVNGQ